MNSVIAHYRITSKLGEGGTGAVYRATDTKLNREVARLWAGRKFRLPRFFPVGKQEVIHSDGCRLLWKGRIRVGGSLPEYPPKLAFPSDGRGLVPTRLVQAQLAHAGDGTAPDATVLTAQAAPPAARAETY